MFEFPGTRWFFQPGKKPIINVLTGSLGTSPTTGGTDADTFNYKVCAEVRENETVLVASYFRINYAKERKEDVETVKKDFELSEDGIRAAADWLDGEYREFEKSV